MSRWLWKIKFRFYRKIRQLSFFSVILKSENRAVVELFKSIPFQKLKTIADLGTGYGNSIGLVYGRFSYIIGIDYCLPALRQNHKHYPDINLIASDVLSLPLKKNNCDLILCVGLSEYIKDIKLLFDQINLCLSNAGYCIITISPMNLFNLLRFLSGHRIYLRNSAEFKEQCRDFGFQIIEKRKTLLQRQFLIQKNPASLVL